MIDIIVMTVLITIIMIKCKKKKKWKIKEKGKQVRQVGLLFNSFMTKHLWSHLGISTINDLNLHCTWNVVMLSVTIGLNQWMECSDRDSYGKASDTYVMQNKRSLSEI